MHGITKPNTQNIEKLATILEVPTFYFESEYKIVTTFLQLTPHNQEKVENYAKKLLTIQEEKDFTSLFSIKVINDIELSAGFGESIYDEAEIVEVFANRDYKYDIATWINGDSMEPVYQSGEVALIKKGGFDYEGAVYAIIWNEKAYIKKVYLEKDSYRLVSLNPNYSDIFVSTADDLRIVGKITDHFMPV